MLLSKHKQRALQVMSVSIVHCTLSAIWVIALAAARRSTNSPLRSNQIHMPMHAPSEDLGDRPTVDVIMGWTDFDADNEGRHHAVSDHDG